MQTTQELIGCDWSFLNNYLLKTFQQRYEIEYDSSVHSVHIDHIQPLSSAKTEEDVRKLCHYSNLQLLLAEDNWRESNKQEGG